MSEIQGLITLGPGDNQEWNNERLILGMDSEVLVKVGNKVIYPHQVKCPQKRVKSGQWYDPHGDWHGDGYAFELCVKPTGCLEAMMINTSRCLEMLTERFDKDGAFAGFVTPTLYTVPDHIVKTAPTEVKLLGCAPSFNVYGDAGNPNSLDSQTRTTGCHLHVSHKALTTSASEHAIRWADIVVGAMWMMISPEQRTIEARRRLAYGRAGEHRLTNYPNGAHGFEYRVLPGTVLSHPAYLTLMFALLRNAVKLSFDNPKIPTLLSRMARKAINSGNRRLARAVYASLPFDREAKAIVKKFEQESLKPLSLRQWISAATSSKGYYSWYRNKLK